MKSPFLVYTMHALGGDFRRNEIVESSEFLSYHGVKPVSLKMELCAYDSYRGELILELAKPNGSNQIFTFYNQDAINSFLKDMRVRTIDELKNLEGKKSLEGIFSGNALLGISTCNYRLSCSEVGNELKALHEINLAKQLNLQSIEVRFILASDKVCDLVLHIMEGNLGEYGLSELLHSKEKLENSVDNGILLWGECIDLSGNPNYFFPNFDKYIEYANGALTLLDNEIERRIEREH